MSIVKKQHYVWRNYLRAWAEDEKIWTYIKKSNKIEKINLMGVAQERYFYKLVDFTNEEEVFLKNLINRMSDPLVKNLNMLFFNLFTSTNKLKKQLENTMNTSVNKDKIAEEIRELEINLLDETHGKMENLGNKLIKYQSLEELKTIEKDDYLFEAIMFLCFQYFRTKNLKNYVGRSFIDEKDIELAKKLWNIVSCVMATNLSRNISCDPNLRFIFYENNTTEHFITCDQPVFNILNDKVNKKGEVIDLEFYYPISPKNALLIHFRNQTEKFVSNYVGKDIINYFNNKVIENSDFYIFADTREQLEQLMNNNKC